MNGNRSMLAAAASAELTRERGVPFTSYPLDNRGDPSRSSLGRVLLHHTPLLSSPAETCLTVAQQRSLYASFLSLVLVNFAKRTANLRVLRGALEALYARFRAPADRGEIGVTRTSYLFAGIRDDFRTALESFRGIGTMGTSRRTSGGRMSTTSSDDAGRRLAYGQPFMAKMLMIAAFVASANANASRDKELLGYRSKGSSYVGVVGTGGGKSRSRSRSRSTTTTTTNNNNNNNNNSSSSKRSYARGVMSTDRNEERAMEAQLEGPASFPLERLLFILKGLFRAELGYFDLKIGTTKNTTTTTTTTTTRRTKTTTRTATNATNATMARGRGAGARAWGRSSSSYREDVDIYGDADGDRDVEEMEELIMCGRLHNEILHRIESLVQLGFLARSSTDVLDDRVTYQCLVSKEVALELARHCGIQALDQYLIYI